MPFSWDQMIPGHSQTFKERTISLYIDENRRLDGAGGVRDFMKENYNFDKRSGSIVDKSTKTNIPEAFLPIAASLQNGASRRTITLAS